ncbi:two-component regulator propeller domain-containing protein [Archangium sp.]|uniref:two-component regulator propeller domain-containing protein n=1 Tax=Archangium sp. TaxID=1872627 RepID=UPI00286A6F12|nr:two-component regulator propeller domain-containing protein [Archangium sp.]
MGPDQPSPATARRHDATHSPPERFLAGWWLALVLGVLLPCPSAAARTPPGRLPFVPYGAEVGLGQWNITNIAQDSTGLLWVGTDDGLYRYDGHRFQPVPLPPGLSSGFVHRLAPGREGGMWCMLRRGTAHWHQGRWRVLDEARELGAPLSALVTDAAGTAWATSKSGLFREREEGHFEPVSDFPGPQAQQLFFTPQGDLYVQAGPLLQQRTAQGRWHALTQADGLPSLSWLHTLHPDSTGRLWFGGQRQLVSYHPPSRRVEDFSALVGERWIVGITTDLDGTTWLGSTRGLLALERGQPRDVALQLNGSLQSLFVDREGSLWVGVNGLYRLAGRGLWRHYGAEEGLGPRTVWSLVRDRDGTLWVGTNKGLARATETGFHMEPEVPSIPLLAVQPLADGRLWLAGTSSDVLRYEPRTRRLERFALEGATRGVVVFDVALDAQGRLWVGSSEGLFVGEASAAAPRLTRSPLEPLSDRNWWVDDLLVDSQQRLWVAGHMGLIQVGLEHGEVRRLGKAEGLRTDQVTLMTERRNGELCVAYRYGSGLGCFRYDGEHASGWMQLDRASGLSSDTLYQLGEDAAGRLWAGSGKGMDLIEAGRVVEHFTSADGLPGDDHNSRAFLAEPNGDVWVGTNAGLGRFLGARYGGPPRPPPMLLTSATAGGVDLLRAPRPLELPYQHGTLEFDVAPLGFLHPGSVERQVRLVGVDEEFHPEPEQGRLRYVGLPPGDYELLARARYPYGEYGPVTRFSFAVRPAWWQTWWARLGAVLSLVGALALVGRVRQMALRRRNAQLEQLVAERTEALERAQARVVELERESTEQRMAGGFAHEMRNALAGARLMLSRVLHSDAADSTLCADNSQKLKELYLGVRERLTPEERPGVATLLKQLNANEALLDTAVRGTVTQVDRGLAITRLLLEYSRLGRETPGREPVSLAALARSILAEMEEDLRVHAIRPELAVPEQAVLTGREEHFYSVLKNLVSNARDALVDTPGERARCIRIAAVEQGEQLRLEVEDTGPGIPPEYLERIFEPFFSTKPETGVGLGLGVVRKLVLLYGGTVEVRSEVGQGTRFVLTLPRSGARASG